MLRQIRRYLQKHRTYRQLYALMQLRTEITQGDIAQIWRPYMIQGIIPKNWEFLLENDPELRYGLVKITFTPLGEQAKVCANLKTNDLKQAYTWGVNMSMACIDHEFRIIDHQDGRILPLSEVREYAR